MSGCTECNRLAAGKRSQHTAVAELRAANLEPLEPYVNVDRPWRCRCLVCGEEVGPRLGSIRIGKGCRVCGRKRAAAHLRGRTGGSGNGGKKDVSVYIERMRAKNLEPLAPYPGAAKPWRCRCLVCGHEVTPLMSNVRKPGRGGCKWCGAAASKAKRLDAESAAVKALLDVGLEPLEPCPGANPRWRVRCLTCGAETAPRLMNVRNGKQGACQHCVGLAPTPEPVVRQAFAEADFTPLAPYPRGTQTLALQLRTLWQRCRPSVCRHHTRTAPLQHVQGACGAAE